MKPQTVYDTQSNGIPVLMAATLALAAFGYMAGVVYALAKKPTTTYHVVLHDPCSAFGAPQPCTQPAHAVSVHKDIESALREVRKDHINRRMSTIEGAKQ